MRRIVLCIVVAVALGACGGGKSNKKNVAQSASSTTSSTAAGAADAATAAGATPTSGATAAGGTATTAKPAAGATTAAGGSATGTGTPTGSATSPAGSSNPSASTTGSGGKPTMTATPAGKYHYAISGTSSFGTPPPGADLVVDPPQGNTQHTRVTVQSQAGTSTTDTTISSEADGVHLVDLTTTSSGVSLSFHPNPPPLIEPPSLQPGSTIGPFEMTSTDGKTIAKVTVTVQAAGEKVALGDGSTADTYRVEVDTQVRCASGQQCPFQGTLNSTRWIRSDGLEVKEHAITDGSYSSGFGTVPVKSDTTSLIDKGTPS